ncbi:MAG: hypothetical protein ACTHOE_11240 [Conexibacter sp.]
MTFDIGRLRRGEQIAGVAAILLFILMFFDWYTVSVSGGLLGGLSVGGNAWQAFSFIDIYLFLVILAAIALAVLTATQRTPALPVTMAVIVTALAALGTLLVLYRLIDTPVGDVPDGVDVSRTIWAFLGFAAVAAITYGGYLSMREEGTSFADARDQARAAFDATAPRGDSAGGASTPPPPPTASEPPIAPPSPPPAEPPTGAASGGEPPPATSY